MADKAGRQPFVRTGASPATIKPPIRWILIGFLFSGGRGLLSACACINQLIHRINTHPTATGQAESVSPPSPPPRRAFAGRSEFANLTQGSAPAISSRRTDHLTLHLKLTTSTGHFEVGLGKLTSWNFTFGGTESRSKRNHRFNVEIPTPFSRANKDWVNWLSWKRASSRCRCLRVQCRRPESVFGLSIQP